MVSLNGSVTFEMFEKLIQHKIAKAIPSVTTMFQKTLDKRKQTAKNAAKAFSSGE